MVTVRQRPEVGPATEILVANLAAQTLGLRYGLLAVLVGDAILADDDLGVDARLFDAAENFNDAAEGARAEVGHRVISTVTMSPGSASLCSPDGIWTSIINRRSNGTTNPIPLSSTS